jgi:hypothetical protein
MIEETMKGSESDPHNKRHDPKLNPWNVLGAPVMPRGPLPDSLDVGTDGSTVENPRPRPDIRDPRFGNGRPSRMDAPFVVRVDLPCSAGVGPYRLEPGLFYLCLYADEIYPTVVDGGVNVGGLDAKLITPEAAARVEAAKKVWEQRAFAFLFDSCEGDPAHDAFPIRDNVDLRSFGQSVWGIIEQQNVKTPGFSERMKGAKPFSFGKIYSWRVCRELPKPVNVESIARDTALSGAASLEALRSLVEAQTAMIAELKASREGATKEGKSR